MTEQELISIKGIGKIKAKQIMASLKLAKMLPIPTSYTTTIRSPRDVFEYSKDMQYLSQEHFVVLGLNTKNEIMFKESITVGTLNSSIVHPRKVF